jgi:hypothetical protein
VQWLLDHFGISADGVAAAVRDVLASSTRHRGDLPVGG